jgi:U3 small nucleolar RNA-associated protein 18
VDAPLAQDFGSDEESDDEIPDHGGDSSDDDEDEVDVEVDDEEEVEDSEESDSDSDSAPEFDGASANSDDDEEVGGEGQYEEKGANAPRITIPEGVVDFSYDDDDKDVKGKGKAVWHDSADDRISVDMEKDNRMKKLARGKKGGLVDGQELQKRLRQQCVPS